MSPSAEYVLSCGWDGTIRLWDLRRGECIQIVEGDPAFLGAVSFSPDGQHALAGGQESIYLYRLSSGSLTLVKSFGSFVRDIKALCFSPDGRYALSGCKRRVALWTLPTGNLQAELVGHSNMLASVCFSPDGRHVLTGSFDETARYWNLKTGKCHWTLLGHTGAVRGICFSSDGKYAVTGGEDATIRIWDLSSGKGIFTLEGHEGPVNSVSMSLDGRVLMSGGADKTVRIHELEWNYEFPAPAEWDEGVRKYLEIFLWTYVREQPERPDLGELPLWSEEDFENLLNELSYRGFGWISAGGIKKELERMTENWRGH
jgi:WD40 repeat protein